MPFCPGCKQEYEAVASRCPDCEVDLVAVLPPDAGGPVSDEVAAFLALDAGAKARMVDLLAALGVPARVADGAADGFPEGSHLVLVPRDVEQRIGHYFDADPQLARDEALEKLQIDEGGDCPRSYRFHAEAAAGGEEPPISDPPLLQLRPAEIAARGDAVLPELIEIVRRGDGLARERALLVLRKLGTRGLAALVAALAILAREGRENALYAVLRETAERLDQPGALEGVGAVALDRSLPTSSRVLALHALARHARAALFAPPLELLLDPETEIAEAADEALCSLTDRDVGFDGGAPEPQRRAAADRWRQLLERGPG